MSKLFKDNLDADDEFQIDNEYAKNYDVWRKKEELNKLKTKYGDELELDDSSSSSDDDEDGVELTEQVEKDFFKTLACLKNKDPRIYDKNVHFFNDQPTSTTKKEKKKKEQPMYLKDYERNILLEKGGVFSDAEDDIEQPRSPTYVEEQKHIKETLQQALDKLDDDKNDEWGGIFKKRVKTKEETEKEEADYRKWLLGKEKKIANKKVESELKPLKEYWNKPDLDDGEKFLRDYILNKKFLDKENDDYVPTYDEIVHDSDEDLSNDDKTIEKQEEFEHKYNFRFEEPDHEFIKRYPRTMENSVRKSDDRRKLKRQEIKERKKTEKEEKMKDLKKLQELKRKEIEEKLEKLKEVTGNTSVGFGLDDIDGDFDPEEHDRKMQTLFNNEFYEGQEDDLKPEFPELDEELEIENWDRYGGNNYEGEISEPHCEDDNFNMDCDYVPQQSVQKELTENSKGKQKRKRKSKFAQAVSQVKPKFDPDNQNYEEYFDEYYKLDCEDVIGDLPCRFKYRKVIPNDFGLSIDEILFAKERELNKWCSLKKAIQIRPDHVEKYEQIAYKKKGQNINLKKKILPSLFATDDTNKEQTETSINSETLASNKERKENQSKLDESIEENKVDDVKNDNNQSKIMNKTNISKKKGKNKQPKIRMDQNTLDESIEENKVDDVKNNTKKSEVINKVNVSRKKRKNKQQKIQMDQNTQSAYSQNGVNDLKSKKKRKLSEPSENTSSRRKTDKSRDSNSIPSISDARLSAYGINPKKFKNRLKYMK